MDGPVELHPWVARHKLDVRQYHRMAEVGILGPDDRVELIEGELVAVAPPSARTTRTRPAPSPASWSWAREATPSSRSAPRPASATTTSRGPTSRRRRCAPAATAPRIPAPPTCSR